MSAPGHQSREQPSTGNRKPAGSSSNRLSLDSHYIHRPDIKTSYIDTHCHLFTTLQMLHQKTNDTTIPQDRVDLLVAKLFPPNVKAVVDIHCDLPIGAYHEMAALFTGWPAGFKYYFSAGAHPHVAMQYTDAVHQTFVNMMGNPRCVAWGECGLDFFKNEPGTHQRQKEVFIQQILGAVSLHKPIVIHTREADEAMQEILEAFMPRDHTFHVHCFTSGRPFGNWVLKTFPNAYIGITGVVSYNLPHVQNFIKSGELPLERMLMETDSPFMTPKNIYRWLKKTRPGAEGKKRFEISHSGMIPFTAELVAEWVSEGRVTRGEKGPVDVEEVLKVTAANACKVYGIVI